MCEKMDLKKLREKINTLDSELKKLLDERLSLANDIANYKLQNNIEILNRKREDEILDNIEGYENDKDLQSLYSSLMLLSRQKQYKIYSKNKVEAKFEKFFETANCAIEKVGYAGDVGSYSFIASREMYPNKEYLNYKDFYYVIDALNKGEIDVAVLPLENSTAGIVNDVYDLLNANEIYIVNSKDCVISHCLMSNQDATFSDINKVISHPQAIWQCSKFIEKNNFDKIKCANTFDGAKAVKDNSDIKLGAIGSKELAEKLNLKILKENINNTNCNQTRFVSLSKKIQYSENANKMAIAFKLPHKAGALSDILLMFSYLDISLSKIQSRPLKETAWEYIFFVDFEFKSVIEAKQILYQLDKETDELTVLGVY